MSHPRLRMLDVRKRFGATAALQGVSLSLEPGEVHALIGENGAGKSTLMKVLSGAHAADEGCIELDGQPFSPGNPHHARRSGIATVYQELTLAPHLSVEENILLGEEPNRAGWLNRKARSERAKAVLAELQHTSIPLDVPVGRCTIAEQQIIEIARALVLEPKVLILDEPTSSLTKVDTENLFRVIERLKSRGVSIIYITHYLEECQRIANRYTVLRDGQSVGTGDMKTVALSEIIRLMVGREVKDIYPRTARKAGEVMLSLKNVAGRSKPVDATLELRTGEILGVAGLIGAGRTETARTVFGLDRMKAGSVAVLGVEDSNSTPAHRWQQGIGLLSEDRKAEGLMLGRSLADNLTLTRLQPCSRFGLINGNHQQSLTRDWMQRLSVKATGPDQAIGDLSGGNQQKIAIGRLLHHEARILLLDEPTRGIDVGSKAQIYQLMDELAASGCAILFISSYLPELLGVCDRIAVMSRGSVSEIRSVTDWNEHSLIAAAIGKPSGSA
ncbi:MAG TPA: sugar ABC transporter ATP-binding protein [Roseimicrobium sp.]|nr:sugar ABC transporter ATP-binding protein [Roseimicrobium sp.]